MNDRKVTWKTTNTDRRYMKIKVNGFV